MSGSKTILLALTMVLAGLLPAWGEQSGGDRIGWKDTIVVAADETRDSVASFGGDVIVDGKVRRSVFAMGGTITVSGEVGDAVVGLGSRIVLKSTAVIKGDLVSMGGTIEKEPGFRIEGDTVYFKDPGGGGSNMRIGSGPQWGSKALYYVRVVGSTPDGATSKLEAVVWNRVPQE